jgi:hypothetical protein
MHSILSTRPNQVPIAITTGIGPAGPSTVLHQAPSPVRSARWEAESDAEHNSSSSVILLDDDNTPVRSKGKNVDPRNRAGAGSKATAGTATVTVKAEKVKAEKVKAEKVKAEKVEVKAEKVPAGLKVLVKEEKVAKVESSSAKAGKGNKKVSSMSVIRVRADIYL